MNFVINSLLESWRLLVDSAVYMLFGILVGGLLKMYLSPATVARHLGRGRVLPVLKAALLGVPLPLCSCGVLPAAASLKKQGANNGATTAFLIATPESGVDSMAITYALLDPLMTAARPLAALATALAAGLAENFVGPAHEKAGSPPALGCPVDSCCDGIDCPPQEHARHHNWVQRLGAGLRYALLELWGDLAGWFLVGLLLAGVITTLVPAEVMTRHLGGGLGSMLIMLAVGIPLYICATASTPIAAALILKGVSPGAALVFLLAGPATNITSLTVLYGLLGRRATFIYLAAIAVMAVLCGLALDQLYAGLGISAQAVVGQAAEIVPSWARLAAAVILLALSVRPVWRTISSKLRRRPRPSQPSVQPISELDGPCAGPGCGCGRD
ncbi:MAG: permease [Desulfarculus sp.]|nr:MAG: permease [Desulfarculus sp.]